MNCGYQHQDYQVWGVVAQWLEHSPTNMTQVVFPDQRHVGQVCVFSTVLREVFYPGCLVFSSPQDPTFDLL